jgi:raffinose/stachyose/melibiose transport system substrate-binding protein
MKRILKALLLLMCSLVLVLAACSNDKGTNSNNSSTSTGGSSSNTSNNSNTSNAGSGDAKQEVVLNIPHYKSGENVGAKFFLPQVERFNQKYAGQYKIVIEEIPQDDYMQKIKLLAQQNKLPALIEGGDKVFMEEVIIANNLFYDLKPWLDSKPEIKNLMMEASIDYNTTADGKIVSMPLIVQRPIGLYYNKEMFAAAGITKPISQMTFDEFDVALEALKQAGYTPLALMTGENAWTTMLLTSALLANEPGGAEILNSKDYVYDYTDPMWIRTFERLQKWFQNYTTDNAIGAVYADAANNFLSERTALIFNGTWMIGDFSDTSKTSEGFKDKVGTSIYPGGAAISSSAGYTWWIPSNLKQEEIDAALAFLEFINSPEELEAYMLAEGGNVPKLDTTPEFEAQLDPILAELNSSLQNDLKITVQSLEQIWPPQIANPEFGKYLPLLADGTITPQKFAEELTNMAQQFKN